MAVKTLFTPEIENDLPIPPRRPKGKNVGRRIHWPFAELEIGQSFLVPEWADETRAMKSLLKMRRNNAIPKDWLFAIRRIDGRVRVWRIANIED